MADLNAAMPWTFTQEIDIPKSINELLITGEEAHIVYKTIRDVAVVTNKRIIISESKD